MDIIIDAGHGGNDSGAVGNGIIEKDYTLKISQYQYKRLSDLGFDVDITRYGDEGLVSYDRSAKVRNSGATHCICNHINAGGGDGLEIIHSVYVESDEATFIAEKIVEQGQNLRRVFYRTNDNGDDYYYMHRDTGSVNTYIIEYGFLDSPNDDVEQIKNNWIDYAEAVVAAFCEIYNKKYIPLAELSDVSDWAEEAWIKAFYMGINDGIGPKDNVTEEQLMVFFDRLGLLG